MKNTNLKNKGRNTEFQIGSYELLLVFAACYHRAVRIYKKYLF